MWFAGIDWADRHHDAAVVTGTGEVVGRLRVAHSAEGLEELTAFLQQGCPEGEQVACVVETTHGLLISALLEAGLLVCPVNPTTLMRWRPPSGAKSDAGDALLLARAGRATWPDLPVLQPDSPAVHELKLLTRDLEGRIVEQTRLVNQLTACLKAYYPVALACFDGLTRHVALAFLQTFPTLARARAATCEELREALLQVRYPHAAEKATALYHLLHQPQLEASAEVVRAKARLALALVEQLQVVVRQVAAYDQEIARLFLQHADQAVFASLPGAGKRLAPRLLAEWGEDRRRYADAASVQALAGTAPVVFQSGAYRGVRRRRTCVNNLRQALYHFARESALLEDWAKAYYRRKREQGKTRAMALRALANHWVRILYAMWLHATPYDPAIFAAARRAHSPDAPAEPHAPVVA
ncbi:MAG TPA: IS110 family transposase [Ktedonobacterales bacterium]|jgi:transposase|nr:IS110 family transposase [Ktedonobacterales bacterium]